MFAATRLTRLRHDTSRILSHWILPLGWLALLTGMFWVGDRSDYHRLFYILLAAPTLLYVILQPRLLRPLTGSPLFIAFLAFSSYMMLSLSWSAPENSTGSLLKRPLYIALLFFCAAILALEAPPPPQDRDLAGSPWRGDLRGSHLAAILLGRQSAAPYRLWRSL